MLLRLPPTRVGNNFAHLPNCESECFNPSIKGQNQVVSYLSWPMRWCPTGYRSTDQRWLISDDLISCSATSLAVQRTTDWAERWNETIDSCLSRQSNDVTSSNDWYASLLQCIVTLELDRRPVFRNSNYVFSRHHKCMTFYCFNNVFVFTTVWTSAVCQ